MPAIACEFVKQTQSVTKLRPMLAQANQSSQNVLSLLREVTSLLIR